jgi:hypothetical protein
MTLLEETFKMESPDWAQNYFEIKQDWKAKQTCAERFDIRNI